MDASYDEFEFEDALEDDELEMEMDEDEGEDDAEARRRRGGSRRSQRKIRPYAQGTQGIRTVQISNGAGKTAQLQLPARALTVQEFRRSMAQVQRDAQVSAKAVRDLREEMDRQQRTTRQLQKNAAWGANSGLFVLLADQVKELLVDGITSGRIQEKLDEMKKRADGALGAVASQPANTPPPTP